MRNFRINLIIFLFLFISLFIFINYFIFSEILVTDSICADNHRTKCPWPWRAKTWREALCLDPDFDFFDFLIGELGSEDKRDPIVTREVISALESNPIFANCLNTGTTYQDKNRYIDYAFTYTNEDGWTRNLPLTPKITDLRTKIYCDCLRNMHLERFWRFPEVIPELKFYMKDFEVEYEFFRRMDHCKEIFFNTEKYSAAKNKSSYIGSVYGAVEDHLKPRSSTDSSKNPSVKNLNVNEDFFKEGFQNKVLEEDYDEEDYDEEDYDEEE